MNASDILRKSAQHIDDRAAARDQPGGERSMARTVAAFNALTGHQLSERDGWLFMVQLKMARACTTPTGIPDDYEDAAAYSALAGECVADNDNAPKPGELRRIILIQGVGEVTLPAGFDWIAQDKAGDWWAFNVKPSSTSEIWTAANIKGGTAKPLAQGNPNEDWKFTLRKVH